MKVAPATSDNLLPLAELFDQYRVFYRKESNIQGAISFLKERMSRKESKMFVVVEKGELLGFTQLYPLFSSTNMKKSWLLNDLFVAEKHRGRGVSKMLINAAKDLARQTNAVGLSLETEKSNTIGNALYPATGFVLDKDHNYYHWSV